MKTFSFLTLLTVFVCLTTGLNAQNCHRIGNFVGAGDVDVKGSVTMELQANGELHLKLSSDFVSDTGPDLDIYLGTGDRVDAFSVKVEALGSLSGAQTYIVPSAISMDDFQYVTIHCTQYNHYYGAAKLGVKSGDCSALNTQNVLPVGLQLKVSAQGVTVISNKIYDQAELKIFNLQGSLLNQLQLGSLQPGDNYFKMLLSKQVFVVLTTKEWSYTKQYYL